MAEQDLRRRVLGTQENVRVVIRFRPHNKLELQKESAMKHKPEPVDMKGERITVPHAIQGRDPTSFTFDGVLGMKTTQEEAFDVIAKQTCDDVLNGYNGTIFVYGQTGSGKTFTMYGPENDPSDPTMMGVIPRSVAYILDCLSNPQSEMYETIEDYAVFVSFLEIYLEKLRDLLNTKNKPEISLGKHGQNEVKNLELKQVTDLKDVLTYIQKASKNRVQAATKMNATSSRSHMILRLVVRIKTKDGQQRQGVGNFADLAGSEKVGKTEAQGKRLDEAKKINLSLTMLGQVIHSLTKGRHVPYRDSVLTRILKDSLGGNCKTSLVVAASAHPFNREETLSSLRFGKTCKSIKNKAKVNFNWTIPQLKKKLAALEAENRRLQDAHASEADAMVKEKLEQKLTENTELQCALNGEREIVSQLNQQLRTMAEEKENIQSQFETEKKHRRSQTQELVMLKSAIKQVQSELSEKTEDTKRVLSEKERLTQRIHVLTEDKIESESRIKQLNDAVVRLQMEKEVKQNDLIRQLSENRKKDSIQCEMDAQLSQLKQDLSNEKRHSKSMAKDLETIRGSNSDLRTKNATVETQNKSLNEQLIALRLQIEVLQQEKERMAQENNVLAQELKAMQERLDTSYTEREELEILLETTKTILQEAIAAEREQLEIENEQLRAENERLRSEISFARKEVRQHKRTITWQESEIEKAVAAQASYLRENLDMRHRSSYDLKRMCLERSISAPVLPTPCESKLHSSLRMLNGNDMNGNHKKQLKPKPKKNGFKPIMYTIPDEELEAECMSDSDMDDDEDEELLLGCMIKSFIV